MIGKLICLIKRKHKRGKRVTDLPGIAASCAMGHELFRCPRCGATWSRKVKAAA
jgi:hypothetical protein